MPRFRVYEVQDEVIARKWMYDIEASNEDDALNIVREGEVNPIECGTMGEPFYAESGFAILPYDTDSNVGWARAVKQLESVKERSN